MVHKATAAAAAAATDAADSPARCLSDINRRTIIWRPPYVECRPYNKLRALDWCQVIDRSRNQFTND